MGYSAAYGRSLGSVVSVAGPFIAGSDATLATAPLETVEDDLGNRGLNGSLEGFRTDRFLVR